MEAGSTKKEIKVRIFRELYLENENGVLCENDLSSVKLTKLLGYILIYRDKVISHQSLVELFWEDEARNPVAVVKNLIYRLRNALRVLGDDQFIQGFRGGYQWNPNIKVTTDYESFYRMAVQIWVETDVKKREQICLRAIECYRGNFTPTIAGEFWMVAKVSQYQILYMNVLKVLCEIYESQGKWKELKEVCSKAIEEDFYVEEFHCWMIKSLREQGRYGLAQEHYEKVKNCYTKTLGIDEVEGIEKAYKGAYRYSYWNGKAEIDLTSLKDDLSEKKSPEGAFFCEFEVFQEFYREERRRLERGSGEDCMILFSIKKDRDGKTAKDEIFPEGEKILQDASRGYVRIGDIFTRYNSTQYLMLLCGCGRADGEKVAERIAERIRKSGSGEEKIEVKYEAESVTGVFDHR